mmetsp:Transcript_112285/g.204115  ORF Transcript_112285/g.204115 Transcript_112285/m.204115 type:complete len:199 (-) Transcript_112285:105-701(-)
MALRMRLLGGRACQRALISKDSVMVQFQSKCAVAPVILTALGRSLRPCEEEQLSPSLVRLHRQFLASTRSCRSSTCLELAMLLHATCPPCAACRVKPSRRGAGAPMRVLAAEPNPQRQAQLALFLQRLQRLNIMPAWQARRTLGPEGVQESQCWKIAAAPWTVGPECMECAETGASLRVRQAAELQRAKGCAEAGAVL